MSLSIIAIRENFQFKVERSSTKVLVVRCLDEQCNWRLRTSKSAMTNRFIVQKHDNVHTCSLDVIEGKHCQATSWFIEECIKSMHVVPALVYKPDVIVKDTQFYYGACIRYEKVCKAGERVLDMIERSPEEHYTILSSYFAMLEKNNPGSVTHIENDNENRFKYLFMSCAASI